jgi:hypothetical protein
MDRARFANEAASELLEHPHDLHQSYPESVSMFGVVGPHEMVIVERDRILDLNRHWPDLGGDAHLIEVTHESCVEVRYPPGAQRHGALGTGHRHDFELLFLKVKVDLEAIAARMRGK